MYSVNHELSPLKLNDTTPQSSLCASHTQLTPLPNAHSTQRQAHATPSDELSALEYQLKILKTKEEIRNSQYRLNLPPDSSNDLSGSLVNPNSEIQTMISYVKKSIDISSTPTAKPMILW